MGMNHLAEKFRTSDGEFELHQAKLSTGEEVTLCTRREEERLTMWIPTYPDFPDASQRGTLSGTISDGVLSIRNIHTARLHERQGVGSALLKQAKLLPEVSSIRALRPSEESVAKGFYAANGFTSVGKDWVWTKPMPVASQR